MTVAIGQVVRQQIEAHARHRYPEEACGLLVGRFETDRTVVTAAHESKNVAADRRTGFEVDPGFRLRLQREARTEGAAIVGVFHSHPSGDATPSATDRESIWEPDLIWLITAVDEDALGQTRAFAVDANERGHTFREIALMGI